MMPRWLQRIPDRRGTDGDRRCPRRGLRAKLVQERRNPAPPASGRAFALGLLWLGTVAAWTAEHRGRQFLGWDRFESWQRSEPAGHRWTLTSPSLAADLDWNEAVLSWNAETPPGTGLKFELRRLAPAPETPWYIMGFWASAPATGCPRHSVRGQNDAHGDVLTDTLVLSAPARTAQIRVTFTGPEAGVPPRLRFIGLSLLDNRVKLTELPPNRAAWGRELAVPERTQVIYPEGVAAWCSPTSLSMLLAYWGTRLNRPELALDVPAVARAVHDPEWPGTGNWAFNTAFAGGFPGLRAYVTRLSDISELEDWVLAGVPLAVSVSYNLLRGAPRERDDGHLIVVRGFTAAGDVVVNDPGTGREIRRVFARPNLARAWATSGHTVYVVHPVGHASPADRFGHWWSTETLQK